MLLFVSFPDLSGSVAAAAGAQAGDILVEVAGTALAASSNVMQATKLIKGVRLSDIWTYDTSHWAKLVDAAAWI